MKMRTVMIVFTILALSSSASAQWGHCHHQDNFYYSSPCNFDCYWAMERQTAALEGIQRALERREWERRVKNMVEIARIRAESETLAFQEYDRKYQEAKDAAFDAIKKMQAKGRKNELREERIARIYKWKQYRKMEKYRTWRWGIQ